MNMHEATSTQLVLRKLAIVWSDFSTRLTKVPMIARLAAGQWRMEDYQRLLIDHHAQVTEGSRWIARAASSIDGTGELRSLFIRHAATEHLDYKMLQSDFCSVGGKLEEILLARKNLGSEALSAWMFHRASQPNPFDMLGAMFIIEGLGREFARGFAEQIRDALGLSSDQVSFYLYHADHDEDHLQEMETALSSGILTIPGMSEEIIKTARVTARLYLLQLEEIGNY